MTFDAYDISVGKFSFINFENSSYISSFFGDKAGKEDGICH